MPRPVAGAFSPIRTISLLEQPGLSPQLDTFRLHIDIVSRSYWPGLFHCYDLDALPRTNNGLESHFRDTGWRLLRTNGQQGLTRQPCIVLVLGNYYLDLLRR